MSRKARDEAGAEAAKAKQEEQQRSAIRLLGVVLVVLGFAYMGLLWVLSGREIVPIPREGFAKWLTLFILGLPALSFFHTGQTLRRIGDDVDPTRLPPIVMPFILAVAAIGYAIWIA